MRRLRWYWGALVLACVALLAGFFVFFGSESQPGRPQPRQGPPGTGPLTVVAMGDSTVSGEGAGQYTATTNGQGGNWCHRSPNAFVEKIAAPGITAHVNLGCSGAPAEQVALGDVKQWTEGSQAQQLAALVKDHRVAAVVIAVGANDEPKFSNQVNDCFKAWFDAGGPPCSTALKQSWQSKVDAMVPKVAKAKPPGFHTLDPFTVNLAEENGDHYLQVAVVYELSDDKAVDKVKTYLPVIRNRILLLLSAKRPSELATAEGKQKLVDELVTAARASIPGTTPDRGITGAFLGAFVIQ